MYVYDIHIRVCVSTSTRDQRLRRLPRAADLLQFVPLLALAWAQKPLLLVLADDLLALLELEQRVGLLVAALHILVAQEEDGPQLVVRCVAVELHVHKNLPLVQNQERSRGAVLLEMATLRCVRVGFLRP